MKINNDYFGDLIKDKSVFCHGTKINDQTTIDAIELRHDFGIKLPYG